MLFPVASGNHTNQVAPQAELGLCAFHKCTALRQLDLELSEYNSNSVTRVLPECCFLEAGLTSSTVPSDFTWMGPAGLSALANPKASKQAAKDPAGSLPQVCLL